MTWEIWILIGFVGIVILAFIISYIQIRVWLYFGDKFLLGKSNKLKKQTNNEENKK
jgi:hypothetical protein